MARNSAEYQKNYRNRKKNSESILPAVIEPEVIKVDLPNNVDGSHRTGDPNDLGRYMLDRLSNSQVDEILHRLLTPGRAKN